MESLSEPRRPTCFGVGELVKTTTSLCPSCLAHIPARVSRRNGEVWMDKECPEHGAFSALLASDEAHYHVHDARLDSVGGCCGPGQHCGDQVANHSCNVLIEVTQRCNLTCPTCYADSSPEKHETLSVARFRELVDGLLAQGKGDADLVQLSGGEPTLHPELFELITYALDRGVKQVYVNTNGLRLAQRRFAERLAEFGDRVSVYLQFDGLEPTTLDRLRGREDLFPRKLEALAHCEDLGLNTVLVMTLARGVNEDEVGAVVETALAHPRAVKKIMIQPATWSGRYDNPRLAQRITVADVAKLVAAQTGGQWSEADFGPIPCSDPNCFATAVALRTPDGGVLPVSRYFPRYATWSDSENISMISQVSDTFDDPAQLSSALQWALSSGALDALDEDAVDALLDQVMTWQATARSDRFGGLFAIGVKPFMDAWTYDQDRIDKCCVHVLGSDGEPVSFCEYNALNRPMGRG